MFEEKTNFFFVECRVKQIEFEFTQIITTFTFKETKKKKEK